MTRNSDGAGGPETQTFVISVEDKPGSLDRVASVFRRRGFNIASLSVGHTESRGISRMTVVMEGDEGAARRAQHNLLKIVSVLDVANITAQESVERHLALLKIRSNSEARREILQICEVFRARVIDIRNESVIVEITGAESKIGGLVKVLSPFGIIEIARTGAVAMTRGPEGLGPDSYLRPMSA